MAVVQSKIILVSPQGGRSYVIEEHLSDDGRIFRIEALRPNGDFRAQMLGRVPQVEAEMQREKQDEQRSALVRSAEDKIRVYLSGLNLKTAAGLTDAELLAMEMQRG